MEKSNLILSDIRNVLFDFDGTLADTNVGIVRTVQETLKMMDLPVVSAEAISRTIGLPLDECFRTAGRVPEERVRDASALYRSIFMEVALETIHLFPGVEELLQALKEQGYVMAIVSSRHHCSLDPLVEHLGVDRYITHVYGEDERLRPKPAPDMALKILREMALSPAETLVVGDTIYDLGMGRDAGCRTCGVTWGNQDRAQLSEEKPDFIVDRVCDLLG